MGITFLNLSPDTPHSICGFSELNQDSFQQTITWSRSTIETLEKGAKYVQN